MSAAHNKIPDSRYGLDNTRLKARKLVNNEVAVLARGIFTLKMESTSDDLPECLCKESSIDLA